MVPAITTGNHGKPGDCGGPPVFGRPTTTVGEGVAPPAGVGLGETPGVGLATGVGVGGAATVHTPEGGVIWLVSKVRAPFRARARPVRILAPVFIVMSLSAIKLP